MATCWLSLLVLPVLRRRLDAATRFTVVLLISGLHGVAVRRGQDRLARGLGMATLLGSVGVVLLATALVL